MGLTSSLSTGGGQTTYSFEAVYSNAKFTELITIAAEENGLTLADIQAMTSQEQADWIQEYVVLAMWKRWTRKKAEREAVNTVTDYDFESTS